MVSDVLGCGNGGRSYEKLASRSLASSDLLRTRALLSDQTHLEESQACEYYDQYYSSSPHQSSFYPYVASPQRLGLVDFDPSFSPAAHSDFDAGGFEVGFPPSRRSSQGSGSYEGGGDEAGMEDADEAQRLKKERRRANNRTSARTFREKKRVEMENQKATLEAKGEFRADGGKRVGTRLTLFSFLLDAQSTKPPRSERKPTSSLERWITSELRGRSRRNGGTGGGERC